MVLFIMTPHPRKKEEAEQVVTHQPAISFSIAFQHPLNRAGGRTSNVGQETEDHEREPI